MRTMIYCLLLLLTSLTSAVGGDNFIADGNGVRDEYLQAAEDARKDIAVFWTGKALPKRWYKPVPVRVTNEGDEIPASGATTMNFDRGEVSGWSMRVQGNRELILTSVIPHEVQHTIVATITRRPTVRWLDEGMAAMFESQKEHIATRKGAVRYMDHEHNLFNHFDDTQYPPGGDTNIMAVYSTGFSFVEWLVLQKGKPTLWKFATDTRKPSEKFQSFYGLSVSAAWGHWRTWVRDRDVQSRSPLQAWYAGFTPPTQKVSTSKPTLYVFKNSAIFCLGCYNFDMAYANNSTFRRDLQSQYHIVYQDTNTKEGASLARKYGVNGVPAFCPINSSHHVEGFAGTDWLVGRLGALKTVAAKPKAPAPPKANISPEIVSPQPMRVEQATTSVSVRRHTSMTGCNCRACFTAAFNRIRALEVKLAAMTHTTGPAGRDGEDGVSGSDGPAGPAGVPGAEGVDGTAGSDGTDGVGVVSMRVHENKLQVKYTNDPQWQDVGEFPVIHQVVTVLDFDGTVLDSDTYALGQQPIVIKLRRSSSTENIETRITALEPLLNREVMLYVNGELVDSLAGKEALKPGDPIPIYAMPRSGLSGNE